nr:MAG TPA: Protein of unknown function (DUF493) [Caudoviricetes sp.]
MIKSRNGRYSSLSCSLYSKNLISIEPILFWQA